MIELLIDASVVLKWYLMDEECCQEAQSLLERHVSGDLALLAPTILPYEVLNALLVAQRMGRIPNDVTETAFSGFLELEIDFLDPFVDYPEILTLAHAYHRSVYDASYISLAKKNNIDFVTGDKRLFNAVKDQMKWVKWIGADEYS
ncbi:MAG: type II toxin-antitoxin system VapC family toxin [Deltaproteobacteria bacterium]|nr:type II toxin-antitoxin system VapC family toxin [Deltaproteobacteria bacterium]